MRRFLYTYLSYFPPIASKHHVFQYISSFFQPFRLQLPFFHIHPPLIHSATNTQHPRPSNSFALPSYHSQCSHSFANSKPFICLLPKAFNKPSSHSPQVSYVCHLHSLLYSPTHSPPTHSFPTLRPLHLLLFPRSLPPPE